MTNFSEMKECVAQEEMVIHRGLVLFASLLAGVALALGILSRLPAGIPDTAGAVGWLAMGAVSPWTRLLAIGLLLGGALGAVLGQYLWQGLGWVQRALGHVATGVALRRSSVPFAVFLPYITYLYQGQAPLALPWLGFLGLAVGFTVLALVEQKDKRKVYFANPTENDYSPLGLFAQGGVIVLGAGVGWFFQSLSVLPGAGAVSGLWLALLFGIGLWIAVQLLATGLNLVFSKQTFAQVYLVLALACLPLALLPVQTIGVLHYLDHGKMVGGRQWEWLPFVLGGLSVAGGLAFLVLHLLKLKKQPIESSPGGEELFRELMLIVSVPFLVYAAGFLPNGPAYAQVGMTGPVDLFKEGESLSAAQAILMGRLPFQEIWLRHGFLSDIGSGLAAMDWLGGSFEAHRTLLTLLAPLGVVALYLISIFCLPWLWALVLTLAVLTGSLGTVPFTRFFIPMLSFIFTLYFIQRQKWYILILSGLLSALALLASFTAGILALAGHLALLVVYLFFGTGGFKPRLVALGVFLGALLLGSLPWWLYLGMSGSLGAYFENFFWVLTQYGSVFSLPIPGWGANPSLLAIFQFVLPPLVILLGVLTLIQAMVEFRKKGFMPWNILLLVVMAAFFWWRYLNRGETELLQDALPAAFLLLAFFIYRLTAHQRVLRGFILAAFLPLLFVPQPGKSTLTQLANGFGNKNNLAVNGLAVSKNERMSQVYIPPAQAKELDQITGYLGDQIGSAETFYDFSNQPLLYFLVPRRPVTQALATADLATFSQQLQAIRDIANTEVKVVLYPQAAAAAMAVDNIPAVVRQYAVSEYLLQNYLPITVIGHWVVFAPKTKELKPDPKALEALRAPLALQSLPLYWGELGKYDPGQGTVTGHFIPLLGAKSVTPETVKVVSKGDTLQLGSSSAPVRVQLALKPEEKERNGNTLLVQITAPAELEGAKASLSWGGSESSRIEFTLQGDSLSHRYVFRVGALPAWAYQEEEKKLVLELPKGGWVWENTLLLQVADIPELARVKEKPAVPEKALKQNKVKTEPKRQGGK